MGMGQGMMGPGMGMGPGMMSGQGMMGPGMGMGMGPGMMGGQGMMGPGMMGGQGMGPGMMGGQGMGPGMMGPGMGQGMMGPGMGQGMMAPDLELSDEQRSQINKIRTDARKKQLDLAKQMRSEQRKLQALYDTDKPDREAIRAQRKKIQDLQLQVMQNHMTAHNEMDDVLTDEQREQLRYWGHSWTN
jgi:Spy/CpxP family protein refolding chaperone